MTSQLGSCRESLSSWSETTSLKRFASFQNDIIFVDGLWGTGKSLLGPIISGMERVEKTKYEYIFEYVCALRYLNKISPDAAFWLLENYADMSQYHNVIGREINLRWRDDSGFANNPNCFRYLGRLFGGEGDFKIDEINQQNIALNVMSHMLMLVAEPIFRIYGQRVRIIEMVRHPLYVIQHWYHFLKRFYSSRVFTVSINFKENKLPWFTTGWEEGFLKASDVDRALMSVIKLYYWLEQETKKARAEGKKILTLSFESLVMSHEESLSQVSSFLGRKHHWRLPTLLRKQKIPRKTLSQGKGYALYGWSNHSDLTEEEIYRRHLQFVKENGSSKFVDDFLDLIAHYNEIYPSALARFH